MQTAQKRKYDLQHYTQTTDRTNWLKNLIKKQKIKLKATEINQKLKT